MKNMTLEKLGWVCHQDISNKKEIVYTRNEEIISIDLEHKKIIIHATEISFATLECIRRIVLDNAMM